MGLDSQVKTTTALNTSLAQVDEGPKLHRQEPAAPTSPQGRNALVLRSTPEEVGDPEVSRKYWGANACAAVPSLPWASGVAPANV
eukprot:7241-Alexandrium_andersonii.AAC.1